MCIFRLDKSIIGSKHCAGILNNAFTENICWFRYRYILGYNKVVLNARCPSTFLCSPSSNTYMWSVVTVTKSRTVFDTFLIFRVVEGSTEGSEVTGSCRHQSDCREKEAGALLARYCACLQMHTTPTSNAHVHRYSLAAD